MQNSFQSLEGRQMLSTASIAGTVFRDLNASGLRESSEAIYQSVRVYVDENKNGAFNVGEKTATTSNTGEFRMSRLPAGTHRIAMVAPAGWRASSLLGYQEVTVTATQVVTGRLLGLTQRTLIAGNVFNDANGDKLRQSTEAAVRNVRVYLDVNNNGTWQTTERSVLTDAQSAYAFNDLVAGTYRVRVVPPAGQLVTTPTGNLLTITLGNGATARNRLFGLKLA
jgi:hypothetical protein